MILDKLSSDTGVSLSYLERLVRTASHRYKTYEIKKKTGGVRTISHPARELKLLQLWLVKNIFARLPVHDAAFAYRHGRNIHSHASVHAAHNYLLKVDFKEFFPSITSTDVTMLLIRHAGDFSPELSASDI